VGKAVISDSRKLDGRDSRDFRRDSSYELFEHDLKIETTFVSAVRTAHADQSWIGLLLAGWIPLSRSR